MSQQRTKSKEDVRLFGLVAGVVAIGTLYFARAVLVPFALAMILSLLLLPLVRALLRLGVPRAPATLVVVLLATGLLISLMVLVTNQLLDVTAELPTYRDHIESKLRFLNDGGGTSVERAFAAPSEISAEITMSLPGSPRTPGAHIGRVAVNTKTGEPLEVRVIPPATTMKSVASFLDLFVGALVVVVFTIFICFVGRTCAIAFSGVGWPSTCQRDDASPRRCGSAHQPLPALAVRREYRLRPADRRRPLGNWFAERAPLGHTCGGLSIRTARRPPIATLFPFFYALAVFDAWRLYWPSSSSPKTQLLTSLNLYSTALALAFRRLQFS